MKAKLKWSLLALGLFLLFLVLTFPIERLAPKLNLILSQQMTQALQRPTQCNLTELGISLPLGVAASGLNCQQGGEPLLNLSDLQMQILPWTQSFAARLEEGRFEFKLRSLLFQSPTRVEADLASVPLSLLTKIVLNFLRQQGQMILVQPELQGQLSGKISFPLEEWHRRDANIQLEFLDLQLPQQSLLDFIGLRELRISPAEIKLQSERGQINIESIRFFSESLSLALEGNWQLTENLLESTGALALRWQVRESDAIRRSLLGPQLLNIPCPSPDDQGFCVRRFSRAAEIHELWFSIQRAMNL